jgi:tetratricopeptide (TPR) repeat protein
LPAGPGGRRACRAGGGGSAARHRGRGAPEAGPWDRRGARDARRRAGLTFEIGTGYRLLGEITLATNAGPAAPQLAEPYFEKSISVLRDIGAENELALAYAGYGRLYKRLGHIARARDSLIRAREIFDRLGTLIEPDRLHAELAELPAGR